MKEKDKLYREAVEVKSEAVLTYAGKKIAEKKAAEYARIVKEESDIKMPQQVRERIARMVTGEKKKAKRATRIRWVKKISIAACLTILVSCSLALSSSPRSTLFDTSLKIFWLKSIKGISN